MKLPSTPFAKRRLTATVSSTGKLRVAEDANACTATISPHSDRKFPTSWTMLIRSGPPPGCRRQEIFVRLVEHFGAHNGDQAAEPAAAHDLDRFHHDRVVLPMMSRQQLDLGAFRRLTQPLTVLDCVRKRFFDQRRYPGGDTGKTLFDV